MDNQKMWELFRPVLLDYLKNKKQEMERDGLIPTLELLIEDLENK